MGLKLQQTTTTSLHPWLIPGISLGLGISGLTIGIILVVQYLNFNIKGIVNDYAVVQAISYNRVEIDNSKAFSPGDKILLIQMKADAELQQRFQEQDNYELAATGNYEFAKIQKVAGNTLYLTRPPCRNYKPAQKVQAVRVASFEEIRIVDTLKAQPWNGSTGGIVVLEASEAVHLNAPIDVRSCGFQAGERVLETEGKVSSTFVLSHTGYPLLYLGQGNLRASVSQEQHAQTGNGAGIVILKTPTLILEQNSSILASGTSALAEVSENPSPGGAGGSILLDVEHIQHPERLSLSVNGAKHSSAAQKTASFTPGGIINTHLPLPSSVTQILTYPSPNSATEQQVFQTASFSQSQTTAPMGRLLNSFVFPSNSEPPALDLNTFAPEANVTTYFRPRNPPKQLVDPSQIKIRDMDNLGLTRAMIRLLNPWDGKAEQLILNVDSTELSQMGLSYTFSQDKHSLVIIGTSLFPAYTELLGRIQYHNRSPRPTLKPREIEIQVDDGGSLSNAAKVLLEIRQQDPMVKWRFFRVETQDKLPVLYWQTSHELSTYHYILERSTNGYSYTPIAEIPSEGTKTEISNYKYIDGELKTLKGRSFYYRLKQTAPGGRFDYSQPIVYELPVESLDFAIFYKNKFAQSKAYLQIQTPKAGKASIDIYSPAGKSMYQAEHKLVPGVETLEIDLTKWEAGTYITRVSFHHHLETTELIVN